MTNLYDNKLLILIRGVQGSGKSTLADWILDAHAPSPCTETSTGRTTWMHFEADMFFINPITGEYKWEADKIGQAHRWCQMMVDDAMQKGLHVVVSNTFVKKEEMQPYLEMAQQYGYTVQTIICQGEFENIHGVDREKVEKKRRQFEY